MVQRIAKALIHMVSPRSNMIACKFALVTQVYLEYLIV